MPIRPPNFFIPGTQKAGTTYLCSQLSRHPDVFISDPKEPMFFNSRAYREQGVKDYLERHFSGVKNERWLGEGSTVYFQDSRVADRLRLAFGRELKFIVCLRHPTEKAISLYLHNYRRGRMTGKEALTELGDGSLSIFKFSLYSESIERFFQVFGRSNMHFLFYEQLQKDPCAFVESATHFLGIPPLHQVSSARINAGSRMVLRSEILMPEDNLPLTGKNKAQPNIPVHEIEQLHELFVHDVEKTETLLGCDLREWKKPPTFDN